MNPSFQELDKQSAQIYDPQIQNIQQQLSQIPALYDPQRESLKQARLNAFRDIDANAAGRGVFYSGAPAEKQLRYTSEVYTPGLADINQKQQQQLAQSAEKLASTTEERQKYTLGRFDTLLGQQQTATLQKQRQDFDARMAALRRDNEERIARIQNEMQLRIAYA